MQQENVIGTPPLSSLAQVPTSNSFSLSPSPNTLLPRQAASVSLKDIYLKECQKVAVKPNITLLHLLEEAWDRAIQLQQQLQQQQQQLHCHHGSAPLVAGMNSGQGISRSFANPSQGSVTPVSGTLDARQLSSSREQQQLLVERGREGTTAGEGLDGTGRGENKSANASAGDDPGGKNQSYRAETLTSGSSCELPPWAQQGVDGQRGSDGNVSGWEASNGSPKDTATTDASAMAEGGGGEGFHALQHNRLGPADEDEDLEAQFPWESADVQGTDLLAGTQRSLFVGETEIVTGVDSPLHQQTAVGEIEVDPRPPTAPAHPRVSDALGPVAGDLEELCGMDHMATLPGAGAPSTPGGMESAPDTSTSGVQYVPTGKPGIGGGPVSSLSTSPGTSVGQPHDALFAQHANEVLPPPTAMSEKTNSNSEEEAPAAATPEIITEITLSHTMIGRRGFPPVLAVIEHSRAHLERLDLRGNELDNEAVEQLARLLASGFPKLKTVDLRHNRFTYRAAKHLAWMCEGVPHLAHMPPMSALPPSTSRSSVGQCYTMALNPLLNDFNTNRSPSTTRVDSDGVSTVDTAVTSGPGNDVLIAIRSNFRVGYDNVIEEVLLDGCLIPEPMLRFVQQRIADAIYRRDQRKKRQKSFMQMEYMLTVDPNSSLNNSNQQMVLRVNSAHNGFAGEGGGGPGGFHNYSFTHGDVNSNNYNNTMNTVMSANNLLDPYGLEDDISFNRMARYSASPHSASSHSLQRRGDPGSARPTVDDPLGLPAIYLRFLQQMPQSTDEDRRRQIDMGPLRCAAEGSLGHEAGGGDGVDIRSMSTGSSQDQEKVTSPPFSRGDEKVGADDAVDGWHEINVGGAGGPESSLSGTGLVVRPQTTAPHGGVGASDPPKPPLTHLGGDVGNLHTYYTSLESQQPQPRDRKTGSLRETPLFQRNTSSLRFNSTSGLATGDDVDGGGDGRDTERGRSSSSGPHGGGPLLRPGGGSGGTSGATDEDFVSPISLETEGKLGFVSTYDNSESMNTSGGTGGGGGGGSWLHTTGGSNSAMDPNGGGVADDEDEEDFFSALQTENGEESQRQDEPGDVSQPQGTRRRQRPPRTARVATEGADDVYPAGQGNHSTSSYDGQQQLSKSGRSGGGKQRGKGKTRDPLEKPQGRPILMENSPGFSGSAASGVAGGSGAAGARKGRHDNADEEGKVLMNLQNEEMGSAVMQRSLSRGDQPGGGRHHSPGQSSFRQGKDALSSRDSSRMTRSLPPSTQETLPGSSPPGGLIKRDREREFANDVLTTNAPSLSSQRGSRSVSGSALDLDGRQTAGGDESPASSLSFSVSKRRGSKRDLSGSPMMGSPLPGAPARSGGGSSSTLTRRASRSNSMLGKPSASSGRTGTNKRKGSIIGGGGGVKTTRSVKKQRGSISAMEDHPSDTRRRSSGSKRQQQAWEEEERRRDENDNDDDDVTKSGDHGRDHRHHRQNQLHNHESRSDKKTNREEEDEEENNNNNNNSGARGGGDRHGTPGRGHLTAEEQERGGKRQEPGSGFSTVENNERSASDRSSSSHQGEGASLRRGGCESGGGGRHLNATEDQLQYTKHGGISGTTDDFAGSMQDTVVTPLVDTGSSGGGLAANLGIPSILSSFGPGNTSGRYGDGVSPVDTIHVSQSFGRQNTDDYEMSGGRPPQAGSGSGRREDPSSSSRHSRSNSGISGGHALSSSQRGAGAPHHLGEDNDMENNGGFHETESFAPKRVSPRPGGAGEMSTPTSLLQPASSRSFGDTRRSRGIADDTNEHEDDSTSNPPGSSRCRTSPGIQPHSAAGAGGDVDDTRMRERDTLHSVEEGQRGGNDANEHEEDATAGALANTEGGRRTDSGGGGRTSSRSGQRRNVGLGSAREGHRTLHGSEEGQVYPSDGERDGEGEMHGQSGGREREEGIHGSESEELNSVDSEGEPTHAARRRTAVGSSGSGSGSASGSGYADAVEEGNEPQEDYPASLQRVPPLLPAGGPFSSTNSASRFSPPSVGPDGVVLRGTENQQQHPSGKVVREGKSSSVTDVWGSSPVSARNQLYTPGTSCSSYQSGRISPFSGRKSASPHTHSPGSRSHHKSHHGNPNNDSEKCSGEELHKKNGSSSLYPGPFSSQNVPDVAIKSSFRSLSQEEANTVRKSPTTTLPSEELRNSSREERMALLRLRSSGRATRSTGEVTEEKSKPSFNMVSDCWGSFM